MLGERDRARAAVAATAERGDGARGGERRRRPRARGARAWPSAPSSQDVSFELASGEVLGVVALEGQGQDELFDILAGSERPSDGDLAIDGAPGTDRHPGDAIRAGVVLVPADRLDALLMQRSVRENIALPSSARLRRWGPIDLGREATKVNAAVASASRSTRARPREVQRLSGGNQQKVTIARWLAGGVQTMLCFDPTRGIDVGTKRQIYALLRELAEAGAAILLFTTEFPEIQLVCDRAVVIFGGRVVDARPPAIDEADAAARDAYGLPRTPRRRA